MPSIINRKQVVLPSGAIIGSDETVTAGQMIHLSESVPSSQTNLAIAGAWADAKLKYIAFHSDQDCSVHTNEATSGTPQEKVYLTAGKLYEWSLTDSYVAEVGVATNPSPFDGNVSGLFITNTPALTLTVIAIVDPT